ncbi:hypothetical protein PROFUN_08557 [Planoprotostelium fungivorum]|uniref:RING-type E3 ubiquitin transferase n=1 Tax=Planoprotostelium fungivorum TaxID=1890364 RepID=A0A2P6N1S1_9EUKA|nr:hypothetical protein PROFUN_08557 [Planoprotostelium fungivorum]
MTDSTIETNLSPDWADESDELFPLGQSDIMNRSSSSSIIEEESTVSPKEPFAANTEEQSSTDLMNSIHRHPLLRQRSRAQTMPSTLSNFSDELSGSIAPPRRSKRFKKNSIRSPPESEGDEPAGTLPEVIEISPPNKRKRSAREEKVEKKKPKREDRHVIDVEAEMDEATRQRLSIEQQDAMLARQLQSEENDRARASRNDAYQQVLATLSRYESREREMRPPNAIGRFSGQDINRHIPVRTSGHNTRDRLHDYLSSLGLNLNSLLFRNRFRSSEHVDVDNMSYEELLALTERIGNVKSHAATDDVIDSLPLVKIETEGITCAVCLEDLSVGEMSSRLPCNHHYHKECIDKWLKTKKHCPVCNKSVDPSDH